MKQAVFKICENTRIGEGVFCMVLESEETLNISAGQFIDILIDGFTLRRPISVSYADERNVTILYKTAGEGTKKLSEMGKGQKLDVLYELGNGFDTSVSGKRPVLVGGGIGCAPMHLLAEKLTEEGKEVTCVFGFRNDREIILADEIKECGAKLVIATEDGSFGTKGYVTDILDGDYTYLYACGPENMLKAVYRKWEGDGQFSFEERMGCGFGACMGCTCHTKEGHKRICKDGPVLYKEEIIWED